MTVSIERKVPKWGRDKIQLSVTQMPLAELSDNYHLLSEHVLYGLNNESNVKMLLFSQYIP